jgi:hypothetical protein
VSVAKLLVLGAVVASLLMLTAGRARLFAIAGVAAAATEALLIFGIIQLRIAGLNTMLILSAALLVAGLAVWLQSGEKTAVTAATVVALVGALQLAGALG